MRNLTTALDLIGAASVTYGVAQFSVAAAWMAGGTFLLVWSYVAAGGTAPKPAPVEADE